MSLLAPLARLLRTDLNTLLCFREELTKEDVAGYIYEEGEYEKAQNLIDCLPEENAMDKRQLQISILMKQKEYKEAARLLEQSISASLQKANLQLNLLADAAVKEGDTDRAWKLAEYSGKVMEIYGWEYFTHMTAFTVAAGEKDADRSIELLKKMLESLEDAEDIRKSILFVHAEMKDGDTSVWKQMGKNLLMSMGREEEFAFLRDRDDFRELVRKYS